MQNHKIAFMSACIVCQWYPGMRTFDSFVMATWLA